MKKWIAGFAILLCAVAAYAQIAGSNYRAQGGLQWVIGGDLDVESGGDIALASGGSIEAASGSDISVAYGGKVAQAGETLFTAKAVSLTSPTVNFGVSGATYITLTADANLTGVYPTGAEAGQVITIVTGDGSNTIRLDDSAASMTIGGNITLTEGQFDSITLLALGNDEWTCIAAHDN